jgi:hypothetical protein
MRFSCSWCLEFIGGLNVQETRERRSSHPRNCVVHLAENGVKFFFRSPEPSLVAPSEAEEESSSSSGEEESEQSVVPLKPGRNLTSS